MGWVADTAPQVAISHVLHIGAGAGAELPAYLAAGAQHLVLTEADPERAAELRLAAAGVPVPGPHVHLIEAPVSAGPRARPFYRTSLPELSSFRAPTALRKLFPGLKILSQDTLAPADPLALVQELGIDANTTPQSEAALVIEAPGEALGILRALEGAGVLAAFGLIRLREGHRALYEGAPTAGAIATFLGKAGYQTAFEPEPEDPDRPWLAARLDRDAMEVDRLRQLTRVAQSEAKAARAAQTEIESTQDEAARAEIANLRKMLDTLRAELAIAHLRAIEAEAEVEAIQARAPSIESAEHQLDLTRKTLALREADLAEVQARFAALHSENQSLNELLSDLAAVLSPPAEPAPADNDATDTEPTETEAAGPDHE